MMTQYYDVLDYQEQEIRKAFKRFDTDGTGFLDHTQLKRALKNIGDQLTEEECDEFFNLTDTNNDGKIDIEDALTTCFLAWSEISCNITLVGSIELAVYCCAYSDTLLFVNKLVTATCTDCSGIVIAFLERDDNSTCLPGKRDNKKDGKEKKQNRVLNDYLDNLHQKYLSENILTKFSVSVFRRFRPAHYALASFGNRRTCLCQRHQNMALKVRTLKALTVTTTSNPDQLIRQMTDDEVFRENNSVRR
ncbi:unnamed protein product [Mytilus coruscus]|uniref:Sulfhydryl light chain n=1 Tax=Mytilus coruscus TaxID=42192 RepID=A0A6J8CGE4_MYTCO|nr:unnamed protein product [Mytilus coruscus]